MQNKDLTLKEYGKFNDFLNSKVEDANKMIDQLQSKLVQESMHKVDLDSFTALHDRIQELVREKDELIEKISIMESQLSNFERNNGKLQNNLAKILEDNEYLERCIKNFKSENDRLGANLAKQDSDRANVGLKCDELLERIARVAKLSRQTEKRGLANSSDLMIRGLEKEIKSQKDKVQCSSKMKNNKALYVDIAVNLLWFFTT